jgi:hypothetical protein
MFEQEKRSEINSALEAREALRSCLIRHKLALKQFVYKLSIRHRARVFPFSGSSTINSNGSGKLNG